MTKSKSKNQNKKNNKYLRIKDLMDWYGFSRGHVTNLVENGTLPPPQIFGGVKMWPRDLIEEIDRKREEAYHQQLRDAGFEIQQWIFMREKRFKRH